MVRKNDNSGRVSGKITLVTGAAMGLGVAISRRLAEEGATVIMADVNVEEVTKQASDIGQCASAIRLDVTSETEWKDLFSQLEEEEVCLDVLVNNAGLASFVSYEETDMEHWRRLMSVNVDGVFLGCKSAISHMKGRGGGVIVNLASVAGMRGGFLGPAYTASKAAVINLSRTTAIYCGRSGYNIRCNSVLPGITRTPMMDSAPEWMNEASETATPIGKRGEPSDIANAVLYLASDEAKQVTGTELVVDGGLLA